ncbi:MAG TPA: nicotinamide-nucleotide amidohydrolase family protein [Burkholderiales bacterium]|nr:nicotinamide-nucleotide amidohydrolase family protein [Burkholderiales bacterium]
MDRELYPLAEQVGLALKARGWLLAAAESCTGGWVGQALTMVPGSSQWFERGFIVYSNLAKQEMLGVQAATLAQHGAVSEATARELAQGALARSRAQIALAVTGIAGPDGGSADKPVGTVCFAWCVAGGAPVAVTHHFTGDRDAVRRQAVARALEGVLDLTAIRHA